MFLSVMAAVYSYMVVQSDENGIPSASLDWEQKKKKERNKKLELLGRGVA